MYWIIVVLSGVCFLIGVLGVFGAMAARGIKSLNRRVVLSALFGVFLFLLPAYFLWNRDETSVVRVIFMAGLTVAGYIGGIRISKTEYKYAPDDLATCMFCEGTHLKGSMYRCPTCGVHFCKRHCGKRYSIVAVAGMSVCRNCGKPFYRDAFWNDGLRELFRESDDEIKRMQ